MTLRTSSATRRRVVSRSSVVLTTSATSSSSGSTFDDRFWVVETVSTMRIIAAVVWRTDASSAGNSAGETGQTTAKPLLPRDHANIRQIAVALRVIEPVPHHELIRNLEADVVCLNRHLAPRRLVEQRSQLQHARLVRHQKLLQHRQCEAGIEYVFDDDDFLPAQRVVDILGEAHFAGGIPAVAQFLGRC